VYANFERNLRDTIAVGLASGAQVIVATAATNLEDCAPFASLHREGLTEEELKQWESLVSRGAALEIAKSFREALNAYLSASKIDGEYAELSFRIARCLKNSGDAKSAKQHFQRARDLDTLRFRADSRINDIIRFVPPAYSGVALVDTEALLSSVSADEIIGSDLVYEHVHMTPLGSYLLARAIYQQIAGKLSGAHPASQAPSETECERMLALTGYDRSRIAQEMLRRLQKPPFINQLNHSEQVLRFTVQAESRSENPNDTAVQYQWAIARAPQDHMLHYRFGMFLFAYNRVAAAEQLAMAQPWDGFPVFIPDGTQIR
jgi:tetratricopeptide (TPR) repeat protein